MSSYIVDDETINRILSYLASTAHRASYGAMYALRELGYDLSNTDDRKRLGDAMFALNVSATSQRYPGESIETLPGTVGHYEFTFRHETPNAQIALNELQRWIYQCAEGDVPECPLYHVFDHVARIDIMQAILDRYALETAPVSAPPARSGHNRPPMP